MEKKIFLLGAVGIVQFTYAMDKPFDEKLGDSTLRRPVPTYPEREGDLTIRPVRGNSETTINVGRDERRRSFFGERSRSADLIQPAAVDAVEVNKVRNEMQDLDRSFLTALAKDKNKYNLYHQFKEKEKEYKDLKECHKTRKENEFALRIAQLKDEAQHSQGLLVNALAKLQEVEIRQDKTYEMMVVVLQSMNRVELRKDNTDVVLFRLTEEVRLLRVEQQKLQSEEKPLRVSQEQANQ